MISYSGAYLTEISTILEERKTKDMAFDIFNCSGDFISTATLSLSHNAVFLFLNEDPKTTFPNFNELARYIVQTRNLIKHFGSVDNGNSLNSLIGRREIFSKSIDAYTKLDLKSLIDIEKSKKGETIMSGASVKKIWSFENKKLFYIELYKKALEQNLTTNEFKKLSAQRETIEKMAKNNTKPEVVLIELLKVREYDIDWLTEES